MFILSLEYMYEYQLMMVDHTPRNFCKPPNATRVRNLETEGTTPVPRLPNCTTMRCRFITICVDNIPAATFQM
jgi:hypothetical protein